MPRIEKRGKGLTERTVEMPENWQESLTAWQRYAAQSPVAKPDDLPGESTDRENAAKCKAILATVGLASMMDGQCSVSPNQLREMGLDEDSAQFIAAHWLAAYNGMMACRQKLIAGDTTPDNIGMMLVHSQEMGRLQERMWWRAGVDPQTGKRRENLALGKRNQEMAIPRATEARKIHAQDVKPNWHDGAILDALEIRQKHKSYSRWRIAGEIHQKYDVSRGQCDKVLRANGIE
jgi:hypothetical protein